MLRAGYEEASLLRHVRRGGAFRSMVAQNEHGRLIAAAAKAALAPIGCVRKGQSRVWLSDERYWAIMVEFQPSGFSKGAYLNVGASWLWRETRHLAFNVGYRVAGAGFISFETAEQFRPLIEKMAMQAAGAVLDLRTQFPSIAAINRYLCAKSYDDDVRLFDTAVAAGLDGNFELSHCLFAQIESCEPRADWGVKLHAHAAALAALLNNPAEFRSAVRQAIDVNRAREGLPHLANCLEDLRPSVTA